MQVGKTLFAQVMEFVPWTSFTRIVDRHRGNSGVRTLSCAEQFRAMAFAQLTSRPRSIPSICGAFDSRTQSRATQILCALQPDAPRTEPPAGDNQLILFNF